MQQLTIDLFFNIAVDGIILGTQYIGQEQFITIPVDIKRLVKRYLGPDLAVPAQIHQNFILDTARGVGCKLYLFLGIKSINGFD
ncbi:hypothetical protein D3C85_1417720 [compost metagenome]